MFSTNGSGNITQWQVVVQTSGTIQEMVTLNYPSNHLDDTVYSGGCQGCPQPQYYAYANGTWSEGPTPSPTPEPASLALISTGVLAMLGLAWRERRARLSPAA